LLVSKTEIGPDLTSRVDVAVGGRISNLNELRAQIEPVPFSQSAVGTVSLLQSEPGRFTGWINATGLSPGNHRLSVYFENYAHASWRTRLFLWFFFNNHQRRSVIFRVIKRSEGASN
jgi:hypothetical protein